MPLTKAEFDKLREDRDRAQQAMRDRPNLNALAAINENGGLAFASNSLPPTDLRALYEMLRAWYGESVMTEKAKAVIEAAMLRDDMREAGHGGTNDHRIAGEQLEDACSAYRAEQKQ